MAVKGAVERAVEWAVERAVEWAVEWAVERAVEWLLPLYWYICSYSTAHSTAYSTAHSTAILVGSSKFWEVRSHRTSSNHCDEGVSRPGKVQVSSGRFDHTEPPRTTVMGKQAGKWVVQAHRTFSNHIIATCLEFCHMNSGWFDCTEPSLSTSLQGKQGVQGAYALVRGGSSTSNLVEPSWTTSLQR